MLFDCVQRGKQLQLHKELNSALEKISDEKSTAFESVLRRQHPHPTLSPCPVPWLVLGVFLNSGVKACCCINIQQRQLSHIELCVYAEMYGSPRVSEAPRGSSFAYVHD